MAELPIRDEEREDAAILAQMEADGKLRTNEFAGQDELLRLAAPVKAAYAKEIQAEKVLARIDAVQ